MSVLEIVLYSLIGVFVIAYVIRGIVGIKKKKGQQDNADQDDED